MTIVWLSTAQAAQRLYLSQNTITHAIRIGELPAARSGPLGGRGRYRIREDDLIAYQTARTAK